MIDRGPVRLAILPVILLVTAIQGITPDVGDLSSCALLRIAGSALGVQPPPPRPLTDPGGDSTDEVCSPLCASQDGVRAGVSHLRTGIGPAPSDHQFLRLELDPPVLLSHRRARFSARLHELCRLTC